MRISDRVERIFSQAVALQQSSRLRSTVHCIDREVYVLNQDRTILIQFRLREQDEPFGCPLSFSTSDYDSQDVGVRGSQIQFRTCGKRYVRVKTCSTQKQSPSEVRTLFASFPKPDVAGKVVVHREVRTLLDEGLSHLEFRGERGQFFIVQRNIYDGTVLEVTPKTETGKFGVVDTRVVDFGPVGIRTGDFLALFCFTDNLALYFGNENVVHFKALLPAPFQMRGVLSLCVYDELGGHYGREES